MSDLSYSEIINLEELFEMGGGYVLDFNNREFSLFFEKELSIDIYNDRYSKEGRSKANRMREFWRIEDNSAVSKVILGIIEVYKDKWDDEKKLLLEKCKKIAERLASINVNLGTLKNRATKFNEKHLKEQISRIEKSIETDPELAIGTSKELIETCCKTILDEAGYTDSKKLNIQKLTKETLTQLRLIPNGVNEESRGGNVIKRILQNLGAISNDLAELRGLYGTGHGKNGKSNGLSQRHAKLAAGASVTLTTFLFETNEERKN